MRIVIDARFLSVPSTGIASYIEGLINGFMETKSILDNEYIFIVPEKFDCKHWEFVSRTSDIPVVTLQQHLLMPFYLFKVKPDVYHYPHFDLPLALNINSVITIHDLKYIKIPDLFHHKSKGKSLLMRVIMRDSIRRARKVITVSKSTKEDIVNVLKVPSYKIEVIYEAANPFYRVLPNLDKSILEKYSVKLPFVLFVGEIRPHKNVNRLLKAFRYVKQKAYQLIIVGRSYRDYKEPFELVEKLGMRDKVKFLKFVPKKDLLHLYNAATIFILPSLYEGFGIPVLEAMACGTPVITSNISSLPEVAGDAAILVDPYSVESIADGINMLFPDESLQQRMSKKGYEQLRKFSWLKAARETIDIYKKVLS